MKRTTIGGQALIEGIMMRNQDKYAVAVRKPDNEIVVDVKKWDSVSSRHKALKLPLIRGIVSFIESMVVGYKTLMYSASFIEEDEGEPTKFDNLLNKIFKEKAEDIIMGIVVVVALILGIGLFMIAPYLVSFLFEKITKSRIIILLIEAIFRIAIFLLYMFAISFVNDMKRVFMYHGAEHKTINCLEAGEELTVENIKKHSRIHKRCGTSFLFFVIILSIIFFMFIRIDSTIWRIVVRLLLVPVIAGFSYEILRFAGRSNSKIINAISKPGMMLQRLTTKEPDDGMIEVAIKSVEGVFDWKEYITALNNGEVED